MAVCCSSLLHGQEMFICLLPEILVFTSPNKEYNTHFLKILPGLSHIRFSNKRYWYNIFIFCFKKQNIVIAKYYFFYFLFLQFLANTISWIILAIFYCLVWMGFVIWSLYISQKYIIDRGIIHLEEFLL